MSIVMRMRWAGISPEQYDELREYVDWERNQPEGGYLHVAWCEDDCLKVWDVWESAEHFQRFSDSRLAAGVAAVGITEQPEVEISACHAFQRELIIGGRLLVEQGVLSADGYDALKAKVDWQSDAPAGAICHVAAEAGDGMLELLSVWRSPQAAMNFAMNRVRPVAEELGVPTEIDGEPSPAHVAHAVYAPAGAPRSG